MEIDEIKNKWSLLDERLKKQDHLKENIMRKMMYEKTDKSLSRLINYSIFGIVVYLGVIIYSGYLLYAIFTTTNPHYIKESMFMQISIAVMIIYLVVVGGFGIRNLMLLIKINISNPIKENITYIQLYSIRNKKLILIAYAVFIPLFILLLIGIQINIELSTAQWTFILFMIIAGSIYGIWEYKRLYKKNTKIIHDNLKELKELQEE